MKVFVTDVARAMGATRANRLQGRACRNDWTPIAKPNPTQASSGAPDEHIRGRFQGKIHYVPRMCGHCAGFLHLVVS